MIKRKTKTSPRNRDNRPAWPMAIPKQVRAKSGVANLPGAKLWYWDTGGKGEPLVLVHPASGSGLIWGYQQPFFAKAGYRVIGYSRRGFYKSSPIDEKNTGIGSQDLHELIEFLGLERFHILGSAAGGSVVADYAVSHPERLLSMTISSNSAGVGSGPIAEVADRIRPHEQWHHLPRWFRELGPSYRAANPKGTKLWIDLETRGSAGESARQKQANKITAKTLQKLRVPTLMMSGDSDFSTPPDLLRMVARHIRGSEVTIVPESGHSLYWERPDIFNPTVLDFIRRHPAKKAAKRKR